MAESEQDEMPRQIHAVHDELAKLGKEIQGFNDRVRRLAVHIKQAHEDADELRATSEKLAARFLDIKVIKKGKPAG